MCADEHDPRWDEWVDANRLLKFNETNIALQKALQSQSQAAQAAHASSSKGAKASAAKDVGVAGRAVGRKDGARGTKRGREEVSCPSLVVLCRSLKNVLCEGRGNTEARNEAKCP